MQYHSGPAWLEGIRILPQHFQQLEATLRHYIHQQQSMQAKENWGLANLVIDDELLKQGKFKVKEAAGIFKDGNQFCYHSQFYPELSLTAASLQDGDIVFIGFSTTESLIHANNSTGRYVLKSERYIDLASENINAEEVLVKQPAFRLFLDKTEIRDYLTLPIAKIKLITDEEQIIVDDSWLMPILTIQHDYLKRELNNLSLSLEHQQVDISEKVTQTSLNLTTGMHANILLLAALNRYTVALEQQLFQHPQQLYAFLCSMYAELAVFYSKNRMPEKTKTYDHADPVNAFTDIFSRLKSFLMIQSHHQAIKIPFVVDEQGLWHAQHSDPFIFKNAAWYISVHVAAPPETWQSDIQRHFKIAGPQTIQEAVRLQLPGVPFERIATVPPQLPFLNNTLYFRINHQSAKWQEVSTTQALNLHADAHETDISFILWAIPEAIKE